MNALDWIRTHLGSSFYALFAASFPQPLTPSQLQTGMEDIREAMLAALNGSRDAVLVRRVRYATDVQALWYLRADLAVTLSAAMGELAAFEQIKTITAMFEHRLPEGMRARRSPLDPGPDASPHDSR